MESIKNLFRKKHKYHDEFMVSHADRTAFNQASFRTNQLPFKSPYSVVTAPKTKKATRSWAGTRTSENPSRHNNSMYENLAANNNNINLQKTYIQQQMRRQKQQRIDEVNEYRQPSSRVHPNSLHQNPMHSSEYGSADPSPTNPFSKSSGGHSFDSSDCDSDSEASIAEYYKSMYEKDLRKMERKYRKADKLARDYYQRYADAMVANKVLKEQNYELERRLSDVSIKNNQLKIRVDQLEKQKAAAAMNEPLMTGAPEAMCSISELNNAHQNYPGFMNHHHEDDNDDEVKIFRSGPDDLELERARRSTSLIHSNSPPAQYVNTTKLELDDESVYLNLPMKRESPDTQQKIRQHSEDPIGQRAKCQTVHFQHGDDVSDEEDPDEEEEEISSCRVDSSSIPHQQQQVYLIDSTYTEAPTLPLKRSFSDSALNELILVARETSADNEEQQRVPRKSNERNRLRKFQTRYAKADYSSSYSSDDETLLRIREKQLKNRGEVVHYRPPRKSVLNKGTNIYRRFGPKEKGVVAEFDFLQDFSTDVSGLTSS